MSGRESGSNPAAEGKPKTIQKFRRRISKILGKDDVKQANAAAAASSSTATAATSEPASASAQTKAPADAIAKPALAPKATAGAKPVAALRPKSAMTPAENAKIQEEKVKEMFAKYNMSLEAGDWKPTFKTDIARVEKKVRMRVHRTCHRCQTQFGADKVCNNCNHNRCKKCPRFPTPKKEIAIMSKDGSGVPAGEAAYVKKPITQRSRRICHKCQTPFKSKTAKCEGCQHERCGQCLRDTAKSETDPGTRSFVKWTCHECQNVHRDPENPCLKCGHSKCGTCPKETVKKVVQSSSKTKGTTDVQDVQRRMEEMGVSTSQASAA